VHEMVVSGRGRRLVAAEQERARVPQAAVHVGNFSSDGEALDGWTGRAVYGMPCTC
jgi:hypothetical protein